MSCAHCHNEDRPITFRVDHAVDGFPLTYYVCDDCAPATSEFAVLTDLRQYEYPIGPVQPFPLDYAPRVAHGYLGGVFSAKTFADWPAGWTHCLRYNAPMFVWREAIAEVERVAPEATGHLAHLRRMAGFWVGADDFQYRHPIGPDPHAFAVCPVCGTISEGTPARVEASLREGCFGCGDPHPMVTRNIGCAFTLSAEAVRRAARKPSATVTPCAEPIGFADTLRERDLAVLSLPDAHGISIVIDADGIPCRLNVDDVVNYRPA